MLLKLDKIDKRILYELDKNARIPDTKLAKLVGRSKESVRYRIKRLEEQGIIKGFSMWIDLAKVGYGTAKIYLTLANNPKSKKEFTDYVKKDKRLFWLGVAEGVWNIGLTYFVKSNNEFFELKNDLFSKFEDLILDNHIGILVNLRLGERKFFYKEETDWMVFLGELENYELEDIEKKILKELHNNSRINVVDIAEKTGSTEIFI